MSFDYGEMRVSQVHRAATILPRAPAMPFNSSSDRTCVPSERMYPMTETENGKTEQGQNGTQEKNGTGVLTRRPGSGTVGATQKGEVFQ